jgi:hypothetical protein
MIHILPGLPPVNSSKSWAVDNTKKKSMLQQTWCVFRHPHQSPSLRMAVFLSIFLFFFVMSWQVPPFILPLRLPMLCLDLFFILFYFIAPPHN